MIYTVTFNPAIDYVVRTPELVAGAVNRAQSEQMFFGGKGINVSCVLKELGVQSVALGFTAGFTGEAIEKGLADMGIDTDFVRLKSGCSRINVKIKADAETELNGKGPDIDKESLRILFEKLDGLKNGDTLVLAGSVPPSLPSDIYEQILARLDGRGIRAVVDATGGLLLNVLKYRPFLIKPNNIELGELFGVTLESDEDIEKYARKLRDMGAANVLVSMAGDGAMLIDEQGEVHRCGVCKGEVVNSVGAGDSMLAGFLAGAQQGYDHALKLGTACGGATAFSSGLADAKTIDTLLASL
ncbi:MAG: 1-phosphofructokinase [Ruminococcus sp.]|nr:1-phosphofructokinase [Ruminococcus sp.]